MFAVSDSQVFGLASESCPLNGKAMKVLNASPSRSFTSPLAIAAALLLFSAEPFCMAVEPDYSDELPRIKPLSPADALRSFVIIKGFRIELAAAEPLVVDPVAMAFDASGRLFVVEMRGYSEDADKHLGRVRLLTDTDQDGQFDKSTVFLDKLSWPTAVTCFDGGVFVAVAPDILYCKDVNGDGVADLRKRVFTGFGRGNVQGLVNTLKWGLDHRIHGATSSSGGTVKRVYDRKAETIRLQGRDFSFDPYKLDLRPESGGGQHGMSFDHWGRKFVTSNSDHLQAVMYEDRYAARNPFLAAPRSRISIAADGPQAPVYRLSPVEPWRIVRTRLRVAKKVPGPIEGGGKPAGYFTGATGVTIYQGNAMGKAFSGLAFIGDVGSNIVHRKRITPRGAGFIAHRLDQGKEFLASTDIWFRPSQFANGPDGALYIADMYREVIEHPASLPSVIKKHLDLTSGRDRGRIYRVVRRGFRRPKDLSLAERSTAQLVSALTSDNGWRRSTAARLLFERRDHSAVQPLRDLSSSAESPIGRAQALASLHGLRALSSPVLLARLDDDDPRVRVLAVRLSESVAPDSAAVRRKLYLMANDADVRVRYQLAFTLGQLSDERRLATLVELLKRNGGDPWLRFAAISSLKDGAETVLELAMSDDDFAKSTTGNLVRQDLTKMIAASKRLRGKLVKPIVLSVAATRSPADKAAREAVIKKYRVALTKRGDPQRGVEVFTKNCAACHRVGNVGKTIGPNLTAMRNRGAEAILVAVLDPNREVNPQYLGYQVITHEGRSHTGMILSESASSISLLRADGTMIELLRGDLAAIKRNSLSFMPDGMEKSIGIDDMANLLAYLMKAP